MTEIEKRARRCCFTGHRPEKLSIDEKTVKAALEIEIARAYADGYRTFISGMARGVDIWASEIVLAFRNHHEGVHLICAIPHPDFEKYWSQDWKDRYSAIRRSADLERTICPRYSPDAYQRRNEWMVDKSSLVIAVYTGGAGGTRNTIRYAEASGVAVRSVFPSASEE